MEKEWFEEWFDSPYYHLLYKDRDWKEAQFFVKNLAHHLQLSELDKVLDLACGRGRHAIQLSKMGVNVTGIDLSKASIEHAKQFENPHLSFLVHDMRTPLGEESFSHVLNLFTSFGYFSDPHDNSKVLKSVHTMLKPGGIFVLDFLNVEKVISKLPSFEEKKVGDITFKVTKKQESTHLVKTISFHHEGTDHFFEERLTTFTEKQLRALLTKTSFEILDTFGNYQLNPFHSESSERLLLIAKKRSVS